ncbi:TPA: hypothetical protein SB585_001776, partial [Campylobacter jejuni]|nr:hypothetical protein [Campylobacter jejuni]
MFYLSFTYLSLIGLFVLVFLSAFIKSFIIALILSLFIVLFIWLLELYFGVFRNKLRNEVIFRTLKILIKNLLISKKEFKNSYSTNQKNDDKYPYNYSKISESFLQINPREYFTKDGSKLNVIVIDTETTGLREWEDEILQLSIIDETGCLIFDKYFKPQYKTSWIEAQKIHGISPAFVQDKSTITNYILQLENIFNKADVIMGYNLDFDLKFIRRVIDFKEPLFYIDVMKLFTSYYHENSSILPNIDCGYRYKRLTFAAWHFKNPNSIDPLNFKGAHGALEDAKATLYVFEKLEQSLSATPNYKNFRERLGYSKIIDLFYEDFLEKERKEIKKKKLKEDMKDYSDEMRNQMMKVLDNGIKISKITYDTYTTFYVKTQKNWIMKVYFSEGGEAQKAL